MCKQLCIARDIEAWLIFLAIESLQLKDLLHKHPQRFGTGHNSDILCTTQSLTAFKQRKTFEKEFIKLFFNAQRKLITTKAMYWKQIKDFLKVNELVSFQIHSGSENWSSSIIFLWFRLVLCRPMSRINTSSHISDELLNWKSGVCIKYATRNCTMNWNLSMLPSTVANCSTNKTKKWLVEKTSSRIGKTSDSQII